MDIEQLQNKIIELERKVAILERQALKLPLSPASAGALNQSFISTLFDKFNVRILNLLDGKLNVQRLFLTTGNAVNPTVEGEIVYHSTTPSLKIFLGGTVKTFTIV